MTRSFASSPNPSVVSFAGYFVARYRGSSRRHAIAVAIEFRDQLGAGCLDVFRQQFARLQICGDVKASQRQLMLLGPPQHRADFTFRKTCVERQRGQCFGIRT